MFKKAQKKFVNLKVAITGPSGSGKTYSALRLAHGLGQKIAVIDTENGSAALYSDKFEFDTVEIAPPFFTEKYIDAIKMAEKMGYDVLVIDSISHAWASEGGLLSQKEQADSRGGNSYTNWAGITKKHEVFKNAFLHANIHIICTMRSKQEYVMEANDKGKMAPKKVGLAPIQRDGMEYEFTTVFDVAMNHEAGASKDRTGLFADKFFKITEDTGAEFKQWLSTAVQPEANMSLEEIEDFHIRVSESIDMKELENLFNTHKTRILELPTESKNTLLAIVRYKKDKFTNEQVQH